MNGQIMKGIVATCLRKFLSFSLHEREPTDETAYKLGFSARSRGIVENPYPEGCEGHFSWSVGYQDALDNEMRNW